MFTLLNRYYKWWEVMYKFEPSDFKKLIIRHKSIIFFTMPPIGDKLES